MSGISWRTVLAITAVIAALLAAIAGDPSPRQGSAVNFERLARSIAQEKDHVTALELAQWIRSRKPGLRIVDLRSADSFDEYHLPGAERIAIQDLPDTQFGSGETVVLISDAGGHAAQGWVLLEAAGHSPVFFLRGGIAEWTDDVMHPTLATDASPSAVLAFRQVAEISRYYGGVPRVTGNHTTTIGHPSEPEAGTTANARSLRRGGC